jgi:uncharacterized protein
MNLTGVPRCSLISAICARPIDRIEQEMPSLSDRLKSLGVQVGAGNLQPPRKPRYIPIEQVVPGFPHLTPRGETYLVEQVYAPDHQYGRVPLNLSCSIEPIAAWAGEGDPELVDRICHCSPGGFAFLDIETTGLMGGTGTYPFLVGIGRFDEAGFRLAQFFMRDPSEEPAHLLAIEEFLGPCETLVTYNGKSFDVPVLNTRYVTQGWKSPLTVLAQIDLLHLARRVWRDHLPSRTLGAVETSILGARRSEEDVPGWMIPQLYFDYLHTGDAFPLKSVFYHNLMDVLAMAALLNHTAGLLKTPTASKPENPLELIGVARLYEDIGRLDDACRAYQACLDAGLPTQQFWDTLQRLSFIKKRQGKYSEAFALWKIAAEGKQLYAHVELAKYLEHQLKDYKEAYRWTQEALLHIASPLFPSSARQSWQPELEHRLARLERKLSGISIHYEA